MELLYIALFGVFGAIIGSFLNVYILRLHTGKDVSGRSACAYCGFPLKVLHLIPVVSFFFLKGRCKNCETKVSWQYPLVEFATAIMFAVLYSLYGLSADLFLSVLLLCVSIVVFVYDVKHMIIPQKMIDIIWGVVVVWFALNFAYENFAINILFDSLLSVLIFSGPIFIIWLLSKGKAMGLGDVRLTLPLSLLLSPKEAYFAITLAFVSGAVWALFAMFINKVVTQKNSLHLKSEVPFAPFLLLAFWIVFLFFPYYFV